MAREAGDRGAWREAGRRKPPSPSPLSLLQMDSVTLLVRTLPTLVTTQTLTPAACCGPRKSCAVATDYQSVMTVLGAATASSLLASSSLHE